MGYSSEALDALFRREGYTTNVKLWNAPLFRLFYLPLRVLLIFSPKLVRQSLRLISRWDLRHHQNDRGFLILEVTRN